jgi:methylthioribose-1-phosphate isomerase
MVKTIEWLGDFVRIIDQRVLPHEKIFLDLCDGEAAAVAIETMAIRGAPAIGVCAAMGIALEARRIAKNGKFDNKAFTTICDRMARTRPTAVNLFIGIDYMKAVWAKSPGDIAALENAAVDFCEKDIEYCRRMGMHGAKLLPEHCTVITHCNAGALATAGYGTALGMIRAAKELGKDIKVYSDETRPWMQGARLTSWELMEDNIDVTLIADSVAASLMAKGLIHACIVGADRITTNGDAANKIGTYSLAVNAKHHNVPFYVVAPTTTIDFKMNSGRDIPIEERPHEEVTHYKGMAVAAPGVKVFNPSFDVTPAALITKIITEEGAFEPASIGKLKK